MASITCVSLPDGRKVSKSPSIVLDFIQKCEKSSFSRTAAFDFDSELKKRGTEVVAFVDDRVSKDDPPFVAYLVLAHVKAGKAVALHKICVEQQYRSQRRGSEIMQWAIKTLRDRGRLAIQLWVEKRNSVAQALYESAGFQMVSEVEDYYGLGRDGISMKLVL